MPRAAAIAARAPTIATHGAAGGRGSPRVHSTTGAIGAAPVQRRGIRRTRARERGDARVRWPRWSALAGASSREFRGPRQSGTGRSASAASVAERRQALPGRAQPPARERASGHEVARSTARRAIAGARWSSDGERRAPAVRRSASVGHETGESKRRAACGAAHTSAAGAHGMRGRWRVDSPAIRHGAELQNCDGMRGKLPLARR